MKIRKVHKEDSGRLIELLKNIGWFRTISHGSKTELKEKFEKHIEFCKADNSHSMYVLEDNNEIILAYISVHWMPYLFLEGPEGFISELFIRDNQRGKGIGTKLLNKVKEEAKERGCSRLSLLNGKNRESYERRFYQKQGFIERDQMMNFIFKF